MNRIFLLLIFALGLLSHKSSGQAPGTNPEEGRGTYKNRTFFNLEHYWDSTIICNNPHKGRFIELAVKPERETEPGWYKLGEIMVQ
jgi:hypothetical protein